MPEFPVGAGIPRREEITESVLDYFIVTLFIYLFISGVYHKSSNIWGFIPETMHTFPKLYKLRV